MEIDTKQLKMGIEAEKEHSKVLKGDKKKIRQVAKDHLKEIPDYYTRLKKMEKRAGVEEVAPLLFAASLIPKAASYQLQGGGAGQKRKLVRSWDKMKRSLNPGMKEAWVDPIEVLHKATVARIRKGAKEGKYWIIRSEGIEETCGALGTGIMNELDRNELIKKILETTTTGAIGGRSMPFGGGGDFNRKGDIAFGARNKVAPAMLRNAVNSLMKGKSKRHPVV